MSTLDDSMVDPTAEPAPFFTGQAPEGKIKAYYTEPAETIAPFGFLTPQHQFGDVERGNPLPYTLPLAQRREIGMERETWSLEIVADPATSARWVAVPQIALSHAVRR